MAFEFAQTWPTDHTVPMNQASVLWSSRSKADGFGVLPVYCNHESLCKTREAITTTWAQMIQIGHWTSCNRWLTSCYCIGNYEMNTFDGSLLVLTELVPGSADLMMSAKRPPYATNTSTKRLRHKTYQSFVPDIAFRQKELVWFPVTLEEREYNPCFPEFINGPPRFLSSFKEYNLPNNCKVFTWASNEALIQQVQGPTGIGFTSGPKTISWHLLLPKKMYHGYGPIVPSMLFSNHRNYWAETINNRGVINTFYDYGTPKNTIELKEPPEALCFKCACILDGLDYVAPLPPAPLPTAPPAAAEITTDDAPTELIVEAPTVWSIADSYAAVVDCFLTSIGV